MKTVVQIKSDVKYLSEVVSTLPSNCLLDKGKVGCGGTFLAIESKVSYVIAVPFVSLIENKVSQHKNILGVYGDILQSEIKNYVSESVCPIIMTTYDSIDKVTKCINPRDYRLLIDEYHLLFMQYSFRDDAVNKVLSVYKQYKDFCFMTATPLEEEFILDELKDIDVVEYKWDSVDEVSVIAVNCPKGVINSTIDLINDFLNNKKEGNLYLFVNSVNFIKEILENTKLDISNCNVIYSKNNKTELSIDRGLLPNDKKGLIPTKKINLLTSTVFEGSDIYDENGKIYVISDATKAHTLIDISTSFQQIAGRIRNSKYNKEIYHFYSSTRYTELSYDEFKKRCLEEEDLAKEAEKSVNNMPEKVRAYIDLNKAFNNTYVTVINNSVKFNPNLVKLDMYNFKVCKHLYKIRVNNLENEYGKYGYSSESLEHRTETKVSIKDKISFEEIVNLIEKFYKTDDNIMFRQNELELLETAFTKYPYLKDAIDKLGYDFIKEQKYHQDNIRRKVLSLLNTSNEIKILKMIKSYNDVSSGNFIKSSVLKDRFTEIYKQLGINKTAKGSDISMFFYTKEVTQRVKGKSEKGYLILNSKVILETN